MKVVIKNGLQCFAVYFPPAADKTLRAVFQAFASLMRSSIGQVTLAKGEQDLIERLIYGTAYHAAFRYRPIPVISSFL